MSNFQMVSGRMNWVYTWIGWTTQAARRIGTQFQFSLLNPGELLCHFHIYSESQESEVEGGAWNRGLVSGIMFSGGLVPNTFRCEIYTEYESDEELRVDHGETLGMYT